MNEYWQTQKDKPLFEDLLWSRPENKIHAGKLLIVGGNLHGFAAPAEAYQESIKAGIGTSRALLPDALQKTVGRIFEAGEYAPSTPSGSFAVKALSEFLDFSMWSDAVLLAGNFGKNSETAILLEKYLDKYEGRLAITGDALDYFLDKPAILDRENTYILASFQQLQKLSTASKSTTPLTSEMGLLKLVEGMHEFSNAHKAMLAFEYDRNIVATCSGKVITAGKLDASNTKIATHTTVWWLQNQSKPLEAWASAVHSISVA